jgi:hypothetical protein
MGKTSMVGLFINTIPVRIRFEEKMKFYRLLQLIQKEALAGEPYHYHQLAEIFEQINYDFNVILGGSDQLKITFNTMVMCMTEIL